MSIEGYKFKRTLGCFLFWLLGTFGMCVFMWCGLTFETSRKMKVLLILFQVPILVTSLYTGIVTFGPDWNRLRKYVRKIKRK